MSRRVGPSRSVSKPTYELIAIRGDDATDGLTGFIDVSIFGEAAENALSIQLLTVNLSIKYYLAVSLTMSIFSSVYPVMSDPCQSSGFFHLTVAFSARMSTSSIGPFGLLGLSENDKYFNLS